MVGILSTESLNLAISAVIENAHKHLVIISPFLRINQKMRASIQIALKRDVKLTVIYGKSELDRDTMNWLKSLPYCNIGYVENLHAKLILNEEAAVMSSMNLYEFSQVNNEELGMIAWMKDGRREFKDLLYEAVRLINLSVKQCGKWDIEDIDEPLRGKLRKETVFIPVDHLMEEEKIRERTICHCIRCGRSIPSDYPYPYCGRCLESWKQYMNLNYTEPDGHCYICGNACRASAERPACSECFGRDTKLVDEKCESMRRLASDRNRTNEDQRYASCLTSERLPLQRCGSMTTVRRNTRRNQTRSPCLMQVPSDSRDRFYSMWRGPKTASSSETRKPICSHSEGRWMKPSKTLNRRSGWHGRNTPRGTGMVWTASPAGTRDGCSTTWRNAIDEDIRDIHRMSPPTCRSERAPSTHP